MLEPKVRAWIEQGRPVTVLVDLECPGVLLPASLRSQGPTVLLQYGRHLQPPIPDLELRSDGLHATLSFQRQPTRTFVPWEAVLEATPKGSPTEHFCVLCERVSAQVEKLVEGNAGCLCADCAAAALATFEASASPRGRWLYAAALQVLDDCPRNTLLEHSWPLLRAAGSLAAGDPTRLREVRRRAVTLAQWNLALELTAGVPPEQRSQSDGVESFLALLRTGRLAEAETTLEALRREAADEPSRLQCLCDRVALALEQGGAALEGVESQLREAEALLARLEATPEYERVAAWRWPLLCSRARYLALLGRAAEALPLVPRLEAAEDAASRLAAGDVAVAAGQRSRAGELYRGALELTPPDGPLARVVYGRLAALT